MVTSIPNGVPTLITQNVQYALPAGQCYVLSTAALDYSQDGSSWSTLTGATTGIVTGAPFIRCPGSNATVTAKKDVQMGGSGSTVIADIAQVNKGLFGNGTVALPSISYISDPAAGFYKSGSGLTSYTASGIQRLQFGNNLDILTDSGLLRMGAAQDTALGRGSAAGKITLTGTTPMLQFGGTTNSFVAFKQSGNEIQVKLADDSAFTSIRPRSLILQGGNFLINNGSDVMLFSNVAPTISSGFGTSPSIITPNGTANFLINVGTGGTATAGVIALPTATNGWGCIVTDITAAANHTGLRTWQTGSTTTTVIVESQNSAGAATAWAASSILRVSCFAY